MAEMGGEEQEQRLRSKGRWCTFGEKQAVSFGLDLGMSRRPAGHRYRLGPFRRVTYFNLLSKKGSCEGFEKRPNVIQAVLWSTDLMPVCNL